MRLTASGAAAAALPTLDVGVRSLAGAEVLGIEGILNGTTNYILTKMEEGVTYSQALAEAQARGIAEPEPTMDVDGWDTAAKLVIISNSVMGTGFRLDDVAVSGIRDLAPHLGPKAAEAGKALRLMGKCSKDDGSHPWKLEVGSGPARRGSSAVRGPGHDQGGHVLHGHHGPDHGRRGPLGPRRDAAPPF